MMTTRHQRFWWCNISFWWWSPSVLLFMKTVWHENFIEDNVICFQVFRFLVFTVLGFTHKSDLWRRRLNQCWTQKSHWNFISDLWERRLNPCWTQKSHWTVKISSQHVLWSTEERSEDGYKTSSDWVPQVILLSWKLGSRERSCRRTSTENRRIQPSSCIKSSDLWK